MVALALWDLVTLEVRMGAVKVLRWSCFGMLDIIMSDKCLCLWRRSMS